MKRLFVGAVLFLASAAAHAAYPDHTGFVTDLSGLLPPPTRDALENKLRTYRDATSIEIAVLITPTLDGMSEHDYADGLWKKWGIGKKGDDNGVLLLVAPPPLKRAWIGTGYGIQGWLTDVHCKHIVADVMKPLNLHEKRAEAVVAGVDAIIAKLGSTPWVERAKMAPPKDDIDGNTVVGVIAIIVILAILLVWFLVASSSGSGLYYGSYSGSSYGGGSSSSSSWSDSGGGSGSFGGGDSGGGGGGGDSG